MFFGTTLSLFAEFLFDVRVSVAAPYFNRVMAPLMLVVVALMGFGPFLPWRGGAGKWTVRRQLIPLAGAALVAGAAPVAGIRDVLAVVALAVISFAALATAMDIGRESLGRAARRSGRRARALAAHLISDRRRHGGLLVHFGILVIALGLVGSGAYQETRSLALSPGDAFELGGARIHYVGITREDGPNYAAQRASFSIREPDGRVESLHTERRRYPFGAMTTTEAGIRSGMLADLYLALEGVYGDGRIALRAYRNPLVNWIWFGWAVALAGVVVAWSGRSARPPREAAAYERASA